MKNVFKDGACFTNYEDGTELQKLSLLPLPTDPREKEERQQLLSLLRANYAACNEVCSVNAYCKTKTEEKKKKTAAAIPVTPRTPCSVAELEAFHTQFLKELNELLPRMEVQTFPKGQIHTFLDDKGQVRCEIRTVPNFNMQVTTNDAIFNNLAVECTADIGDLMKKIRLGITKPDATTVQVPAVRSTPALPVVPAAPVAKAESKAKAPPADDDFSQPCGKIG